MLTEKVWAHSSTDGCQMKQGIDYHDARLLLGDSRARRGCALHPASEEAPTSSAGTALLTQYLHILALESTCICRSRTFFLLQEDKRATLAEALPLERNEDSVAGL